MITVGGMGMWRMRRLMCGRPLCFWTVVLPWMKLLSSASSALWRSGYSGREIVGKLEDKGVEDVVVFGNEGTGGLDVETVAAEDAAEACEEAVAIGHEHHDLKAVALGKDAAADGRTLGVVGEVCGVPEDFPRLMADVVCAAEYAAEFLLVFEGNGRARELIGRGLFASVGEAFGIVVFAV